MNARLLKIYWPLVPAFGLFAFLAHRLRFTQDDAFITYRYVANYLAGDGLVYNIGERIEGFTNFGWTVLLLLAGVLKIDYMSASEVMGYIFGFALLVVVFQLARRTIENTGIRYAVVAVLLVAANQSFAYWAQAGLETAAFAFFAAWSLYLYVTRNRLLVFSLTMAVWMRPEGAVVAGILIATEFLESRGLPRFTLACTLVAFLLSLPFVVFKLIYYGGILPNPFYAKTSFSENQWADGFEYVWRYLSHYGFYGIIYVLPLVFFRELTRRQRAVWWFAVLFSVYVIFIGGDVLKVHRFFLPVFGPAAILAALTLRCLMNRTGKSLRPILLMAAATLMLILTVYLPKSYVEDYQHREVGFLDRMQFAALQLRAVDSTAFSVAVPTIGIFGYELLGHDIIDMVGLTDSTIARYSEEPVPGMKTSWKERKHNSKYILQRAPDYIMFSTGVKPSAPAERALMLYPQFIQSYRTRGFYYVSGRAGTRGALTDIFKKVRPIEGELVPSLPLEYVTEYKLGLEAYLRNQQAEAIEHFDRGLRAMPSGAPFVNLIYHKALSMILLGDADQAEVLLDSLVSYDSLVYEGHKDLYSLSMFKGDTAKAAIHARWLKKLVPWDFQRIRRKTEETIQEVGRGRIQPK